MDWLSLIVGAIKALNALTGYLHDRSLLEAGAAKAIAEGLKSTMAEVRKAQGIRDDADKAHAADPTDGAFDNEFERKD